MSSAIWPIIAGLMDQGTRFAGLGISGRNADTAVGWLNQFNDRLYPQMEDTGLPSFIYNNQHYTPQGSSTSDRINLDETFRTNTDFGQMLRDMQANITGYDDAAVRGLEAQRYDPMKRAEEVGAFLPDEPFNKYLTNELGRIGETSRGRLGQAKQAMSAQALSSGRSLEDVSGDVGNLEFADSISRGREVQGARANQEGMRAQTRQTRAGLQAGAVRDQVSTNAALEQAIAQTKAGEGSQMAGAIQSVGAMGTAAQQRDQGTKFDAMMNLLGINDDMKMKLLQMLQGNQTNQAQIKAGALVAPYMTQNTYGDAYRSYLAGNQPGPKGSTSFSLPLFMGGLGGSCLAAETELMTPNGPKSLFEIRPGDEVMGVDHKFHKVVAKDCGWYEGTEADTREFIQIVAIDRSGNRLTLVTSKDHLLGDKPAGQFKRHGRIAVAGDAKAWIAEIYPAAPRLTGDIMLEDDCPYLAEGFEVRSMIGKGGISRWREFLSKHPQTLAKPGMVSLKNNPDGVFCLVEES